MSTAEQLTRQVEMKLGENVQQVLDVGASLENLKRDADANTSRLESCSERIDQVVDGLKSALNSLRDQVPDM